MDQVIDEIYNFIVKAQERENDVIKNRLEFINWLFGVASALLFSAVVAARTITPDMCPYILSENIASLLIGGFAFIAIICTFVGKWQGYNSLGNRSRILTLLDIQKSAFLKDEPPKGSTAEKVSTFNMFGYLPEKQKATYDTCVSYGERWYSEVLWMIIISVFVFMSLLSMVVLLIELAI